MENVLARRRKRKIEQTKPGFPDAIRSAAAALLIATAMLAAIAYGAVDVWAIGFLSIMTGGVALLWIVDTWRKGAFEIKLSPLYLPLLCLVIIGIIQLLPLNFNETAAELLSVQASSAISLDPYSTRLFVIRLVILLIFFAAALTFIDSAERIGRCASAIVILGALLAFLGVVMRMAGAGDIYGLRKVGQAIPFGPFVNQHHFAAFMEMTSGLAIGVLMGRGVTRERKIFFGIAAFLMGIGLIYTGSRGGLLSYVGVFAVAGVLSYFTSRSVQDKEIVPGGRMTVIAGGVALLFGVVAITFYLGGGEALFRGIGPQGGDITSGRTQFWSVAWRIFLDHPIIGAGLDAFGIAYSRYDPWHGLYRVEQAHNDYLQMLSDAGIAGLACVLGFVYLFYRKSMSLIAASTGGLRMSLAIGAIAGCTGIFIHSLFDFPLRTTSNAFFFILLVVFACAEVGEGNGRSRGRKRRQKTTEP